MADGRPCDECGCKIEFLKGPNGKHIPVQRVRTVYVERDGALVRARVHDEFSGEPAHGPKYVSHYETCSNPGRFSGRARQS